ncbi:transcriptional activator HAP5 [Kwoniella mangroviensis CBS 10435]|uniref:Transcriptional activator HAP5 n=1 Tax=Kwoniella mangroviensis CBS 10435 TaxID=1331196 RepID=A0A1B9IKW3_9TREE|nr:transcriptional activator HAP5 [Kwoniella mangroviensis CBS 10435]
MNPSYFIPNQFSSSSNGNPNGAGPSNYAASSSSASASASASASGPNSPDLPSHHQQQQQPKRTYQTQAEQRQLLHPPNIQGPLIQPNQDLNSFLETFWERQMNTVEGEIPDWKSYNLPLARIKKVMKSDEDVRLISLFIFIAPIMFSKACEIFISELTCRAWLVAESHKRRTLQKSDVASAIAFSDMFDFLIDIVPRDDGEQDAAAGNTTNNNVGGSGNGSVIDDDHDLDHENNVDGLDQDGHVHGQIHGVNPHDINGHGHGHGHNLPEDEGEDLYNKYVQED